MGRDTWAAFRAEALKLRKRPAAWVLVGLTIFSVLFFEYLIPLGSYLRVQAELQVGIQEPEQVPLNLELAAMLPSQVIRAVIDAIESYGSVVALALGALTAGSEYGWGTAKTALAGGPARLALYVGQVLAVAATLALLVPVVYVAAAGATSLVAWVEGGANAIPGALDWPTAPGFASGLAVAYLLLVMPAAIGLMLATLLRSTAAAIGLGLAWLLVIEATVETFAFASPVLHGIVTALPGANALSLSTTFGVLGGNAGTPLTGLVSGSALQFSLVLVAYVVVFLVVGALVYRRRDAA